MWFMLSLLSAIGAASIGIIGKTLQGTNIMIMTNVFYFVQWISFVIITLFSGKIGLWDFQVISQNQWIKMVIMGLINTGAYMAYLWALQLGRPASVVAITTTAIVFVVIFSTIFLGEILTVKSVVAAGMIVCGAYLLSVN